MPHGFTLRTDPNDPRFKNNSKKAFDAGAAFLAKHLLPASAAKEQAKKPAAAAAANSNNNKNKAGAASAPTKDHVQDFFRSGRAHALLMRQRGVGAVALNRMPPGGAGRR